MTPSIAEIQSATCGCGRKLGKRNVTGLCKSCNLKAYNADPRWAIRRIAALKRTLHAPENQAWLKRQRTNASRARLSWCPLEYRETYRYISQRQKLGAKEGRRIIEEQIAADAVKYARTGKLQKSVENGE